MSKRNNSFPLSKTKSIATSRGGNQLRLSLSPLPKSKRLGFKERAKEAIAIAEAEEESRKRTVQIRPGLTVIIPLYFI